MRGLYIKIFKINIVFILLLGQTSCKPSQVEPEQQCCIKVDPIIPQRQGNDKEKGNNDSFQKVFYYTLKDGRRETKNTHLIFRTGITLEDVDEMQSTIKAVTGLEEQGIEEKHNPPKNPGKTIHFHVDNRYGSVNREYLQGLGFTEFLNFPVGSTVPEDKFTFTTSGIYCSRDPLGESRFGKNYGSIVLIYRNNAEHKMLVANEVELKVCDEIQFNIHVSLDSNVSKSSSEQLGSIYKRFDKLKNGKIIETLTSLKWSGLTKVSSSSVASSSNAVSLSESGQLTASTVLSNVKSYSVRFDKNDQSFLSNLSNSELALEALKNNVWNLQCVPKELQGDQAVVLAAVMQNPNVLAHASSDLKKNGAFILQCIQALEDLKNRFKPSYYLFEHIDGTLKRDEKFAKQAVGKNGLLLQNFPDLINNQAVVLAAVKKNPNALKHASSDLKKNGNFIMHCIQALEKLNKPSYYLFEHIDGPSRGMKNLQNK